MLAEILKTQFIGVSNRISYLVLDEFEIVDRKIRILRLLTPAGSVIAPEQLSEVIEQFKNCGCFTMRLVFTDFKEPPTDLAIVCEFNGIFPLYVQRYFFIAVERLHRSRRRR